MYIKRNKTKQKNIIYGHKTSALSFASHVIRLHIIIIVIFVLLL